MAMSRMIAAAIRAAKDNKVLMGDSQDFAALLAHRLADDAESIISELVLNQLRSSTMNNARNFISVQEVAKSWRTDSKIVFLAKAAALLAVGYSVARTGTELLNTGVDKIEAAEAKLDNRPTETQPHAAPTMVGAVGAVATAAVAGASIYMAGKDATMAVVTSVPVSQVTDAIMGSVTETVANATESAIGQAAKAAAAEALEAGAGALHDAAEKIATTAVSAMPS